jgi:hypothetical protein
MVTQPKWQLSGDYFENCNCSVVCPCLVSKAAGGAATDCFLCLHLQDFRNGSLTTHFLKLPESCAFE